MTGRPDEKKRIVFMGSPDFAILALARLTLEHDVAAVYTQPPRPAGRGMKEQLVPLAKYAQQLDLPVCWPRSLKSTDVQDELAAFDADAFVVVAYGLLLPKPVLDMPRYGCINGHASLLPRWRGAAPIQRAIAAGDTRTGMSAMRMETGLDTGPVLATLECEIAEDDTAGTLHDRLAQLNADLLETVIADLPNSLAQAQAQDVENAIYAPKISTAECAIDWHAPLSVTDRKIRAFSPYPGTWFDGPKGRIKIAAARPVTGTPDNAQAGSFLGIGPAGQMRVATIDGILEISRVQPAGKKAMEARDFLNGQDIAPGHVFGPQPDVNPS
jgi:methionyl-tRNA formyltransferase